MRYAVTWGLGLVLVAAAGGQPPDRWVTVTGRVVLPAGVPIPAAKVLVGPGGAIPVESVVVNAKTRGIKNVVVWLRPDSTDPKAELVAKDIHPDDAKRRPGLPVVVFTPQQVFAPRILCARVGDTPVVQNGAAGGTNFLWDSGKNGALNVAIPPGQAFVFRAPLVAERTPIPFKSNVVPAAGYVRVFEHPYHAVTDEDGKFELKDAPAGKYRLVYWHERVGFRNGVKGRFGEPVEIAGKAGRMVLPAVEFDVAK
jgi:hypothetical protein